MNSLNLHRGDALDAYDSWPTPTLIMSDGAYGVGGFPGDPRTPDTLGDWYRPHIEAWTRASTVKTSLWFWNTEIGWANTHPVLVENGWRYVQMCVWDKGAGHIAGRVNSSTQRTFPVTTEVAVLYERAPILNGGATAMRDWMRAEWKRTGLPWRDTNAACGVKDAATRKYFASDDRWYLPPEDRFRSLIEYANTHGDPAGAPYFEHLPGHDQMRDISSMPWERRVWNYVDGVRNVWSRPTLRGEERFKSGAKSAHLNQKPLDLMEPLILASSNPGDVVWEPFGGLGTGSVAATSHGRDAFVAESNPVFADALADRAGQARPAA